jgi:CheY-like chemotaxis protein
VLDFGMPGTNGLQLAEAMAREPAMSSVPLLLLSSYVDRSYREQALAAGFAVYLTKPVRKAELFNAVMVAFGSDVSVTSARNSGRLADCAPRQDAHVLVAEDNPINQKVASNILKELGYSCDVVSNGAEVLAAHLRTPYDLILMDCQMPEMDGYETTVAIPQLEGVRGPL